MLEHPYFMGLFALILALLVWRRGRYYLRHAYLDSLRKATPSNTLLRQGSIQTALTTVGWSLLVLASLGISWGFTEKEYKQPVHKYVFLNDGSGSMLDYGKPRGIGTRLTVLNKGNKALLNMLDKRSDGSRDLVGAIVFSSDAFVVSYMVDDPKFIDKKLDIVSYDQAPLGQGTDIDLAIWAGLEMLVSNSEEPQSDFDMLRTRMHGVGHNYKADDATKAAVDRYRGRMEHSCLIIFTDGEFDSPGGGFRKMSIYKQLHLCKDLGVKVYVVSVETVDPFVLRYTADTGGYAQIFKGFEEAQFEKAYESIVQSQAKDEIVVERRVKRSFAWPLGLAALCCLALGTLLRYTTDRNFTEV